jgi:hypothetical protein
MGDETLEVEVLSLFVAEVERLMRQMENATDGAMRRERLQALIGAARNAGAARLAQTARLMETNVAAGEVDLEVLRVVVADTLAFVRQSGI